MQDRTPPADMVATPGGLTRLVVATRSKNRCSSLRLGKRGHEVTTRNCEEADMNHDR